MRRTTRILLAVGAFIMANGVVGAGASAAGFGQLPATGSGLESDGEKWFSVFNDDRSVLSVFDARTGARVGRPIPTQRDRFGKLYSYQPFGILDGRVFMAASNSDTSGSNNVRQLVVADPSSGTMSFLCGDPGPTGLPFNWNCPVQASPDGYPMYYSAVGRSWMWVSMQTSVYTGGALRWGITDGKFWWRLPSASERKQIKKASRGILSTFPFDAPIDLDRTKIRTAFSWGYEHTIDASNGVTVVVRKPRDRGLTRIRLPFLPIGVLQARFASRGLCAVRGRRIVLWDKTSRRVWTRSIDKRRFGRYTAVRCAGRVIVLGPYTPEAATIDSSLRWPSLRSHRGWKSLGVLRAGRSLTVR